MFGGMNPWMNMWAQPRVTIRTIVTSRPSYGVLRLATIYALQNLLFSANYWSLGFQFPFTAILLVSILLAPIAGIIWVYFAGWIFSFTGSWLGGRAPMSHLRAALAWSKLPSCISLLMWFILIVSKAESAFIQDVNGPSLIFGDLILTILGIWSLVLLVQSIREIQGFSILRTIGNILLAALVSSVLSLLVFLASRLVVLRM
jgi:hypothetical protein